MTRRTFIFAGPSLTPEDVARYPDFTFVDPASRGDILGVLKERPRVIGLIDGFFGDRPSVLHKELLEAISMGVRVFGAASMGALRASELSSFGMVGVGQIYLAYAKGELTRDDSVAVAHGPAELGYPALSIAEVDVVATVRALAARQQLTKLQAGDIIRATRSIYYQDRNWRTIAAAVESHANSGRRLEKLLEQGHIQAKRLDALELLGLLRRTREYAEPQNSRLLQVPLTPSYTNLRRDKNFT